MVASGKDASLSLVHRKDPKSICLLAWVISSKEWTTAASLLEPSLLL